MSKTEVQPLFATSRDQQKYNARFMYSQVELGSDAGSESGSVSRRQQFLSQERLYANGNIIYDDKHMKPSARTQLTSRDNSQCRDGSVDVNL
jgi:hypothetical protein